MLWIELKAKVVELLQGRDLEQPKRRLNALNSLEQIIKLHSHDIYRNPDSLLQIDKREFKKELARHMNKRELSGAESSIVNNFYEILQSQPNGSRA